MSKVSERDTVLRAINAVVRLNTDAGTSCESLSAVLKLASEERRRHAFDKFCCEIMATIHGCFIHFGKVQPHLAKTRAHRDFHLARLNKIPPMWKNLTSGAGKLEVEPHNLQAVSRELFDNSMTDFFHLLRESVQQKKTEVKLLADEENALRYSGYVGMKLLRQLDKVKGYKAAQFRECLSKMSRCGQDASFLEYTVQWIEAVNRGGLFVVNDSTFELFRAIEIQTRQILPGHLAGSQCCSSKEELIQHIVHDEVVQLRWREVGADIIDEEDGNELLHKIVSMWVVMRGVSITSKWMEDYKLAKDKTVKKSRSLRKDLSSESND